MNFNGFLACFVHANKQAIYDLKTVSATPLFSDKLRFLCKTTDTGPEFSVCRSGISQNFSTTPAGLVAGFLWNADLKLTKKRSSSSFESDCFKSSHLRPWTFPALIKLLKPLSNTTLKGESKDHEESLDERFEIQSRSSVVLSDLARVDENAARIAEHGGIRPLVELLNIDVRQMRRWFRGNVLMSSWTWFVTKSNRRISGNLVICFAKSFCSYCSV